MIRLSPLVAAAVAAIAACLSTSCRSSAPDEPISTDSGATSALDVGDAAARPYNPLEHLRVKQTPPPIDPTDQIIQGKRDPDWDLDPTDPARDYVRRYVYGVARYGDLTGCVEPQASVPLNGKATVHVTDASPPRCPQSSGVDETFAVDVSGDRLELTTGQADRGKLKAWPDKSDPFAPPTVPVPEFKNPQTWTAPAGKVLKDARLAIVRIQMYGRGTYPFVSLAGFPDWFPRTSTQAARDDLAQKLCGASQGMPMALGGGLDRSHILRIRCGATPAGVWDTI